MCTLRLQVFLLLCAAVAIVCPLKCTNKPPHIIYILVDDMGWNDVSFHGSNQIPTPNIDSLAYHGIILNRHYTQPLCTPSRSSLMTGRYPVNVGIHYALAASDRTGLPLSEKILPQYLKDIGYATHLVGKWHLGFYKKEFTPMERGFDTHFGYWSGAVSYYDHINEDLTLIPPNRYPFSGHDLRRNYSSAWDVVGQYATDVFTDEAVHLIDNHPPHKPLFLYLAHLAVHAGNQGKLLEAPQDEINRFSYISDPNRRSYAAMVSKLDKSIGLVIDALDRKDMLKDSIVVFLSDNGAPNIGIYNNWGSNYPWRGQKATLWEGAVRAPALIWSPLINYPSRVSYELMHITDWLPTLLSATGCDVQLMNIDGADQWHTISFGYPSVRNGLVVDVDKENDMYALLVNNFKYIKGPLFKWSKPEEGTFLNFDIIRSSEAPEYKMEDLVQSSTWQALQKYSKNPYLQYRIEELRQGASVTCNHDFDRTFNCTTEPCLFNIQTDPCEQNNLAAVFPSVVQQFEELINLHKKTGVPNVSLYKDPASNPKYFNGTWDIWMQ
ncbi:hypothetical protein J6590_008028 [Homalodisca vitripennis]|nr:hypothetical protein J6590_008028 [Homalodisca vitripennis]